MDDPAKTQTHEESAQKVIIEENSLEQAVVSSMNDFIETERNKANSTDVNKVNSTERKLEH